uniref:Disintegrin and metalloproteinase domain-containing protein 1 n=1 Tax=Hemiscorpius lepturus TaxID=520031 RepID=A0A3S6GSZ5_HEMLE|nr:disintegrin and metalloproteinase domain-containing protein 1 [Hemiscorpius lepturus]
MVWTVRNDALLGRLICFIIVLRICSSLRSKDVRSEFHNHYVIQPELHTFDGRERRDVSSAKEIPKDNLVMTFEVLGQKFILDLKMNVDLLPETYFEEYQLNSSTILNKPMKNLRRHCHYLGQIRGIPTSWAAISTCRGINGVVFDGKENYYVHAFNESSHILLKASDQKANNFTCGYNEQYDSVQRSHILNSVKRKRRSTVLRPPPGSSRDSRYVELILVNDYQEYKELNGDIESVFERSKQIANILNGLYSPLNIFIALVGIVTWTEKDPIVMSPDGDTTLNNFLHYRRERLAHQHPNDNAQLITGITFNGGVVGKALKGPICTNEYSGGVNMDHSNVVAVVATTVAHELGHNFGMEHDTDECECPEEKCIMGPASSDISPHYWSSCSREYVHMAFQRGMDYCLRNVPSSVAGPICGNGFLEEGEECDCGLKEYCNNLCCNASTCRLTSNATCATGQCCDINTCQLKQVATLCRGSVSECDLPEYCDGESEYCPPEVYVQDGTDCGDGKGYCYNGACQSHNNQCKLLWGSTGKNSHHRCYDKNVYGNLNGNCGYNRINKTFKACAKKDIYCGMLQCTHLNERLEFGTPSAAVVSKTFVSVNKKSLRCQTAVIDLGLTSVDPGLTPNGAKCGEKMACLNQECVPVANLRKKSCPQNCNGNGVCNSRIHCHCNYGYGPPYCDVPGNGGSIDSGPPFDPSAGHSFFIALLVIFLGIVPFIAISIYVMYRYNHHLKNWWLHKIRKEPKKPPELKSAPPPKKFNYPHGTIKKMDISAPFLQHGPSDPIVTVPLETAQKHLHNGQVLAAIPVSQETPHPVPVRAAPPVPSAPVQRSHSSVGASSSSSSNRRASRPLSEASFSKRNLPPPPRPPPPKHLKSSIRPQSFSAGSNRATANDSTANQNHTDVGQSGSNTSNQNQVKKTNSASSSAGALTGKPIRPKANRALKPTSDSDLGVTRTNSGQTSNVASLAQWFEQKGGINNKV